MSFEEHVSAAARVGPDLIETLTDGALEDVMSDRFERASRVLTNEELMGGYDECRERARTARTTHIETPAHHPNHPSTDRFLDVLDDVRDLHFRKGADYGSVTDPFANLRAAEEFDIPAWLGTVIRQNDKITRIKSWVQKGHLVNDSLEDDLRDNAVYAAIALTLFYEAQMEQAEDEGE